MAKVFTFSIPATVTKVLMFKVNVPERAFITMPAATSMWAASRMESRKATAHLRGQAAPFTNWKDNQRDGYGTYKWNVGDSYEGEWKDNKFNGQGTLIQTDGTKYKGGFVNGMEEGSGIQEDKNGNRYEGFFKQGKKHGPFVETDKNGKVIRKGTYKMGRLEN